MSLCKDEMSTQYGNYAKYRNVHQVWRLCKVSKRSPVWQLCKVPKCPPSMAIMQKREMSTKMYNMQSTEMSTQYGNHAKYRNVHPVWQLCTVSKCPPSMAIMQSIEMSNNYMVVSNLYFGVSRNTDSRHSEFAPPLFTVCYWWLFSQTSS